MMGDLELGKNIANIEHTLGDLAQKVETGRLAHNKAVDVVNHNQDLVWDTFEKIAKLYDKKIKTFAVLFLILDVLVLWNAHDISELQSRVDKLETEKNEEKTAENA